MEQGFYYFVMTGTMFYVTQRNDIQKSVSDKTGKTTKKAVRNTIAYKIPPGPAPFQLPESSMLITNVLDDWRNKLFNGLIKKW